MWVTKSTRAFAPDFICLEISAPELVYNIAVRCTGLFSIGRHFGEKTNARGAAVLFFAFGLASRPDNKEAARFCGLKVVAWGEEGRAAPNGNPMTAPEVCEVVVGAVSCTFATAAGAPEVGEVVVCVAGCTVATAAGEALGAGMLLGATTLLSGIPVLPAGFTTAAVDAVAGIAGMIGACL